jgi:hypothetical protein
MIENRWPTESRNGNCVLPPAHSATITAANTAQYLDHGSEIHAEAELKFKPRTYSSSINTGYDWARTKEVARRFTGNDHP